MRRPEYEAACRKHTFTVSGYEHVDGRLSWLLIGNKRRMPRLKAYRRWEAQTVANVLPPSCIEAAVTGSFLRLPLSRHPLGFGDLSGRHLGGQYLAVLGRLLASFGIFCAGGCQVEPHMGRDEVLQYALTFVIYPAEVVLRDGVPLVRGLTKPDHGLCVVQHDALAISVHHAEVVLRNGGPLIGSFAGPDEGLCIVLRHALAVGVHHAEVVLRDRVPLIG